jgi:hypothetical protein
VRSSLRGTVVLAVTLATFPSGPAHSEPAVDYEMPFVCSEQWTGATRANHSPSSKAIDWNRDDDLGRPVVASSDGVIVGVEDRGGASYGLYMIVDHGVGESSVYAHLSAEYVTLGQRVSQGDLIGRVGNSGASSGPHLHFEERHNRVDQDPWFNGDPYVMGTTAPSRNCPDVPLAGDWDGDDKTDVGVFRRKLHGKFLQASDAGTARLRFGQGVDQPLVGNWDGDRTEDVGVRNAYTQTFRLRTATGSVRSVTFGHADDIGVVGDWNGDSITDVGVWRPSASTFLLRSKDARYTTSRLGTSGSLPVTGDWNGDGTTDIAVFNNGVWTLRTDGPRIDPQSTTVRFGAPGDLPVSGDWNADGATDLAVWSPHSATFTLRKAPPLSTGPGRLVTKVFGAAR